LRGTASLTSLSKLIILIEAATMRMTHD